MTLTPHPHLPHYELRDGDRVVARYVKTMCAETPWKMWAAGAQNLSTTKCEQMVNPPLSIPTFPLESNGKSAGLASERSHYRPVGGPNR